MFYFRTWTTMLVAFDQDEAVAEQDGYCTILRPVGDDNSENAVYN